MLRASGGERADALYLRQISQSVNPPASSIGLLLERTLAADILALPRTQQAIRNIVDRVRHAAVETEEIAYQRHEMFDDGTHESEIELAQSLFTSAELRRVADALERKA